MVIIDFHPHINQLRPNRILLLPQFRMCCLQGDDDITSSLKIFESGYQRFFNIGLTVLRRPIQVTDALLRNRSDVDFSLLLSSRIDLVLASKCNPLVSSGALFKTLQLCFISQITHH